MRARTVGTAVAGIGVASGLVVSSLGGVAVAGHLNTVLSAKLSGAQEVPQPGDPQGKKVNDPNGRGSVSIFGIDGDPKTLCYVLRVSKIQLAADKVMGHLHSGVKGKNGPIVVNLAGPFDGEAADCLTEGETLPSGAKAFPTGVKVKKILANPSKFYVNVHNTPFPDGAIRGQLTAK